MDGLLKKIIIILLVLGWTTACMATSSQIKEAKIHFDTAQEADHQHNFMLARE